MQLSIESGAQELQDRALAQHEGVKLASAGTTLSYDDNNI